MYSKEGYRRNSPDRNNPYNIIPSGNISMKNVDHPVLGIDEYGNMQWMMPGEDYQFPGNTVLEIPYMQEGGAAISEQETSVDDEFINYMNHPSYKKRLQNELFGFIENITPEQQKQLDDEYANRLNAIKTVTITDTYPDYGTVPTAIGQYFQNTHLIYADKSDAIKYPDYGSFVNEYKDVVNHEKTHAVDFKGKNYPLPPTYSDDLFTQSYLLYNPGKGFNDEYKKLNLYDRLDKTEYEYEPMYDYYTDQTYYMSPSEIKARLTEMRIKANREYDYDFNDEFDINKYPKLKTQRFYRELTQRSKLTDEEINALMQYVAQNNNNTTTILQYAKKGGIHINPANKGKFTAQANRANMGVQEYANYVLRNKEDFSSTTVKRANFARNANKWKKQEGGEMNEEIIIKIQDALQQGITPEQLVKELQKQGITEQEAIQLVSAAMPQQEEMQQYQYGTSVRHNYADNINFDNKFNATALGLNAVSDPRNMTWALPDTGFGSGLKAISGLASGLAGSYLGYAKLFSDDKIHVQDPKGKPIVSSPYIPEGKDVTKIVKPSSDIPTWDWQTQHPDLTATNMTGKASYTVPNKDNTVNNWYNAPGQNTIGPVEFAKGGMKKYQLGQEVDSSVYDFNIDNLTPQDYYNFPYPYGKELQSPNNIQNPWLSQYGDNTNPNPPRIYTKDAVPNKMDRLTYQHYFPDATIDEGNIAMDYYQNKDINVNSNNQNNNLGITNNKPKDNSTITSMNDDALGFMIANNALIGFQNFNDVLSARDYEKKYNQMLMKTGNSDQRYNPINPTNPYGMYTPNAGIGSNYGLVANSHIQDFGTSMASAKCGGMKKKYKEGGEYNLTQEEIDYILKNGGEIEMLD